ncbi:tetratricopeptide repeat protein [Brachyspira sp.]|nr:tetratricopeptide repeat protein [Brachyspira sp.]
MLGLYEEAIKDYKKVVELNPNANIMYFDKSNSEKDMNNY